MTRQTNFETEWYNEIMHKQKEKDSTRQTENKLYIGYDISPLPSTRIELRRCLCVMWAYATHAGDMHSTAS